ncbi:MAG: glycosyltransferase [Chloroflexota bacterium]|nr:glycosyltransferase [Chloroflexota bacterium]
MNVYVRELSRELGKLGLSLDVFTRWHDPAEPEVLELGDGVRLVHLAAGELEDTPKTDIYRCLPEFVRRLRDFKDREGLTYDLLHSHYWLSAVAAEQVRAGLGIPHVATFHTLGAVKNRARPAEKEPPLRLEAEREAVRAADAVVAFTLEEKENLITLYGAQPNRVRVIRCGVDLDLFRPVNHEEALSGIGIADRSRTLLFAGRLQAFKGIDILLRAVAVLSNHDDLRLLVVGGDSEPNGEVARLRSLSAELGLAGKTTFFGAVGQEKMPLFYSAADICVVPSYHESFGLVALEAMACGTPVVASRVGGLATTVIDGETGYLVDELSPEAFARSLDVLLRDETSRRRMGEAARASAIGYGWAAVAQEVRGLYDELLSV